MGSQMSNTAAIKEKFLQTLDQSQVGTKPFRHWYLSDVFPEETCNALKSLPFDPPRIEDTEGKRETHNSTRMFFSVDWRRRFDVCRDVAEALQSEAAVRKLEQTCGITLRGSFLRIEYCQDTNGFWLQPHTDIGAKLFSLLVYLSTDPGSEKWGTDILDEDMNLVTTTPYEFNCALVFIPGANTWHSFRKRPINGVRKTIIVNYVKDEWRARHELAYPDQAVG
jgi:hypothetical protein